MSKIATTPTAMSLVLSTIMFLCVSMQARTYTIEELDRLSAAKESLKKLESDALAGNDKAQLFLGIYYQFGLQGHPRDPVRAVSWYTQAAMRRNADAAFNLAACLEDGTGVEKNLVEAYAHYTLAIKCGRTSGARDRLELIGAQLAPSEIEKAKNRCTEVYYLIYQEEREAEIKRQQQESRLRLERQVAADKAEAIKKEAAVKEKAKQLEVIKAKAAQGESDAEYKLGCSYETGDDGLSPKDEKSAASWFLKAAMQGHAEAQYRLGLCYLTGKGTPKDLLNAYALFEISGNHLQQARNQLAIVQKSMTDAQIIAGPKRIRELQKEIEASISKKSASR